MPVTDKRKARNKNPKPRKAETPAVQLTILRKAVESYIKEVDRLEAKFDYAIIISAGLHVLTGFGFYIAFS